MSDSLSTKAISGSAWTTVSNWLLKGTTILTTVLILRYLSVGEYGIVQLILSFFSFGILFNLSTFHDLFVAEMGIERAVSPERAKGLFLGYLSAQALFGTLLWLIFFFGASFFTPDGTENYVRIVSFMFLLSPAREAVQLLFNVELRFRELAVFSLIEQISRFLILVVALIFLGAGISAVLLSTVLSQVVAIALVMPAFVKVYRKYKQIVYTRVSILSILLAHGKWGLFVSYVSNFNKTLRIWLVQIFLGTEALGLYGVASNLFSHTRSILPISEVVNPIIPQYKHDPEKLSVIVNKGLKYSMLGYITLGVLGAIIFPPVIIFLFPHFTASIPLYQLMLIGLIPHSLTIILTPIFYAFRAQKSLFFAYIRRIVLTTLLLPVFIKFFGLFGIAIEFVVTALLFVLDRYMMARKLLPTMRISPRTLITFDEYDKVLLSKLKWQRKS
ncbi:MAG TPA: oligosaccharide flippase family protein [Candidatus Paceibacterota bacterium]